LLVALERWLQASDGEVLEAARSRDALIGREISWTGGRGRARGIDDAGRLLVSPSEGAVQALEAGEVHLLAPPAGGCAAYWRSESTTASWAGSSSSPVSSSASETAASSSPLASSSSGPLSDSSPSSDAALISASSSTASCGPSPERAFAAPLPFPPAVLP